MNDITVTNSIVYHLSCHSFLLFNTFDLRTFRVSYRVNITQVT